MNLKCRTELIPEPNGKDEALLKIYINEQFICHKNIEIPATLLNTSYPLVMKAIANAEDSPLYNLYDGMTVLILEALDMIDISLPNELKRVRELENK